MLGKDQVTFCQIPVKPCLFSASGFLFNLATPLGAVLSAFCRGGYGVSDTKQLADVPTVQMQRGAYDPTFAFPKTRLSICEDGVTLPTSLPAALLGPTASCFIPPHSQHAEQCQEC